MQIRVPATFLRKLNEKRLLNAVRVGKRVSRADLERTLQLATPTVSRIVDRLVDEGWLREIGLAESLGSGRPPMLMDINPQGIGAIGIELGRGVIRVVHTNLLGDIQKFAESTELCVDPEEFIRWIEAFLEALRSAGDTIIGIGVAAPGLQAEESGEIALEDLGENWNTVGIITRLKDHFRVPVYFNNDSNAAVLGETWFGAARTAPHAAFILMDEGIGAGLAVHGSIYNGANHKAGEFSHAIVDLHGDTCMEGHRGCVNIASSGPAILGAVQRLGGIDDPGTIDQVIERAQSRQWPEEEVISRALDYLSAGIANLVRVFDPQVIVLGGRTMLAADFMVSETARRTNLLLGSDERVVCKTSFGLNSVAMGAATLVLQGIYDHTQLVQPGFHV